MAMSAQLARVLCGLINTGGEICEAHLSTHSLPGAMPKNFSLFSPGLPEPLGSTSGSVSWKSVSSMYTTLLSGTA